MVPDTAKIEPWLNLSFACGCGKRHEVPIKKVVIEENALRHIPGYARGAGMEHVTVVADARTYDVAGRQVKQLLEQQGVGAAVSIVEDHDQGEVVADERAIVRVLLDMPEQTRALVAVGSGTLHDIVRFAAFKTGRAFLSVPTAPSVDGFASVGAPLLLKGFKQTIPACAPEAIFADLGILAQAPVEMIAAGFGDMLGKYTSLADWRLGQVLLDEHYCPVAAEMTRKGLQMCIDHVDEIRRRTQLGIRTLMEGLVLSGISMLLVGNSRPASGAEHHLSHYWEMKYIEERRKALLHGAKVGAACVMMAELYESVRRLSREEAPAAMDRKSPPTAEEDRESIRKAYGGIADQVLQENFPHGAPVPGETERMKGVIAERWEAIADIAGSVPSPRQLAQWLEAVGGPASPERLGIEPALVEESLKYAMFVRNRFTILRLKRWV